MVSRLQAIIDSRDYKRVSAFLAIGYENEVISMVGKMMDKQRRIGEESGYVDKNKMYGAGTIIVDAKDRKQEFVLKFKSAGGKTNSFDASREAMLSGKKKCLQTRGTPDSDIEKAVTYMTNTALNDVHEAAKVDEGQLTAIQDLISCF